MVHFHVWSLTWAWIGLWPDKDWDGAAWVNPVDINRALTLLAGSRSDFFFLVVWALQGDLDYLRDEYHLQNYNSNDPCCKCPANNVMGGMSVNEFRPGHSQWIDRLYTKAQWATSEYNLHVIFTIPGVTLLSVFPDYMHCKHLGTDAYFFGSVLFVLCFYMLPGTPEQNIEIVWKKIKEFYTPGSKLTRYTNLRLSMFCSPTEPEMRMPFLKGRSIEIRDLGPVLLEAFRYFMMFSCDEVQPLQKQQIEAALKYSVQMDSILDEHRRAIRLPAPAYQSFRDAGFNYMLLFNALGTHYAEHGKKLFNVTIKAHYVIHCVLDAEHLNPRLSWCYAGEDMMFRVRRLLATCTFNESPSNSIRKFVQKYVVGVHLLHVKL